MLGFFASSAINVLSDGFATFLHAGGKMRLIINDLLADDDKAAIAKSHDDSLLPSFDLSNIELLKETLSARDTHFFECLAWLIRNDRIQIRIIAPKSGNGIAHTKCGVFSDGLNKVGFEGSVNFSRSALIENRESLTAMCDWNGETEVNRIHDIEDDFERTFSGEDDTVRYIDASDIRSRIADTFPDKELKQLLEDEEGLLEQAPTHLPITILHALRNAREKVRRAIESNQDKKQVDDSKPHFPYPTGHAHTRTRLSKIGRTTGRKGFLLWQPVQVRPLPHLTACWKSSSEMATIKPSSSCQQLHLWTNGKKNGRSSISAISLKCVQNILYGVLLLKTSNCEKNSIHLKKTATI